MKQNKILWALVAMVLPLGFTSCGDDDEDKVDSTPYEYIEPANKANAARFSFSVESPVQSVAFGEGNSAVIQVVNEAGETEYIVGSYNKQGDTYTVNTAEGKYTFAISTEPGTQRMLAVISTPTQSEPVTVSATQTTATVGGDMDICRTWYPFRTAINMQKRGTKGVVTDELEGIDFEALKNRAEKEGCHIKEDLTGWKVRDLFFQGTGEFGVNFINNESYFATWKWVNANGDIDFDWKDKESVKNEFVNSGKAHAEVYKTGIYKGECWLSLESEVEQDNGDVWDVKVIFRLVDKKL